MRILEGKEGSEAEKIFREAAKIARSATCLRSRCGSIIVADGDIIGNGFNSPAGGREDQRRCMDDKGSLHPKVTDKTCCVHAEQRAIMDALRHHPDRVPGSTLYFIRLDEKGRIEKAGRPYCTVCSKMALDAGVREFVLWHDDGIVAYETGEYNLLSYEYRG